MIRNVAAALLFVLGAGLTAYAALDLAGYTRFMVSLAGAR